MTANDKYLTLLSRTLSFAFWPEPLKPVTKAQGTGVMYRIALWVDRLLRRKGVALGVVPRHKSADGTHWPTLAHTMIGTARLENIRALCQSVEADHIPGAFVECGVWRGGASIFARACLDSSRTVICCDSFNGLPDDPEERIYGTFDFLRVPLEEVRQNFEKFGQLHNVQFVKGWFKDTLRQVAGPIAILRADGDLYSSTMQILGSLYDKVSPGGYVIIDDWVLPPCRKAVTDFRTVEKIEDEIISIDGAGVYWRKHGA